MKQALYISVTITRCVVEKENNYKEQNKYDTQFISNSWNVMPVFEQSHRSFTTKMLIRPAG